MKSHKSYESITEEPSSQALSSFIHHANFATVPVSPSTVEAGGKHVLIASDTQRTKYASVSRMAI